MLRKVITGMKQSDNKKAMILGITGGIGCGKSTVANIVESFGAYLIDCDKISKEVSQDPLVIKELKNSFGSSIEDNGKLCRKVLADIVFQDKIKLALLNSIMHTKIASRVENLLQNNRDNSFFVLDVPIPVREGFLDKCSEVWVVTASLENRIKRIISRDNATRDEVIAKINSQISLEEYLKYADKVIYNNTDSKSLKITVINAWKEFILAKGTIF